MALHFLTAGAQELEWLRSEYELALSGGSTHEQARSRAVSVIENAAFVSGNVGAQETRRKDAIRVFNSEFSRDPFFQNPGPDSLFQAMSGPEWDKFSSAQRRTMIKATVNAARSSEQLIWSTNVYLEHLASEASGDPEIAMESLANQTRAARKRFGIENRFSILAGALDPKHIGRTQYVLGYLRKLGPEWIHHTRPLLERVTGNGDYPQEVTRRASAILNSIQKETAAAQNARQALVQPTARNRPEEREKFLSAWRRGLAEYAEAHPSDTADQVISGFQQQELAKGAPAFQKGQVEDQARWQTEAEADFRQRYVADSRVPAEAGDPSGCAVSVAKRSRSFLSRLIGR